MRRRDRAAAQALDSAKATAVRWKEKAVDGAKTTDQAIRGHPYESIGIGFALGLLMGVLINRK